MIGSLLSFSASHTHMLLLSIVITLWIAVLTWGVAVVECFLLAFKIHLVFFFHILCTVAGTLMIFLAVSLFKVKNDIATSKIIKVKIGITPALQGI